MPIEGADFSFDPRTALRGVTLYSTGAAPEDGVLIVYADFDPGRLTTLAKAAKDYQSAPHRGYIIHNWIDEKKVHKSGGTAWTYAAINGNRVIFAQKEDRVAKALDAMLPEARDQYLRQRVRIASSTDTTWVVLLRKEMRLERAYALAGGLVLTGTDPTGYGGVVAGFSNQRALELLVEAGFTPLEAIRIGTLNGATYLGRADRIGSIATGKAADLVVVRGNPAANIADVEHVELVFRDGAGYDPAKLIAAAQGSVGWR